MPPLSNEEYQYAWVFDGMVDGNGHQIDWEVREVEGHPSFKQVIFWGAQKDLSIEVPHWFFRRTRTVLGGERERYWLRRWVEHRLGNPPDRWTYLCRGSLAARPMTFQQIGSSGSPYRLDMEGFRHLQGFVYGTGFSEELGTQMLRLAMAGHTTQAAELYHGIAGEEHPILFCLDQVGLRFYPDLKLLVCWEESTSAGVEIIHRFFKNEVPFIGIGLNDEDEGVRVW